MTRKQLSSNACLVFHLYETFIMPTGSNALPVLQDKETWEKLPHSAIKNPTLYRMGFYYQLLLYYSSPILALPFCLAITSSAILFGAGE